MNANANGRIFRVAVAAMARLDKQCPLSPLHNMFGCLVRDATACCLYFFPISFSFTGIDSARSMGGVVASDLVEHGAMVSSSEGKICHRRSAAFS